ncbi:MAG: M48 family metallopeptidase [Tsuneonella sp.]
MIDWLRREMLEPRIELGGRMLPIALKRNDRARRLTMRLAPDGSEVRVTLPRWCRSAEALAFVHARAGWLGEQLAKVPERRPPSPGGTVRYRGSDLAIDWQRNAPRSPRIAESRLIIGGPEQGLAGRIQRWLEREAMRLMDGDLADYAARAGIAAPALRLTRAQRRWGSCSTGGTVRINWRLVQAPDAVRRSVVAHEVAHCVHFDHSPQFHALLAALFEGDIADADGWLRREGRALYSAFG